MNEQEILEGNKLIAEFMGYKFHRKVLVDNSECGGIYDNMDIWSKVKILVNDFGDQVYFSIEWYNTESFKQSIYGELQYHTSWGWLMPVVDEIEGLSDLVVQKVWLSIEGNSCGIWTYFGVNDCLRDIKNESKFKVKHSAKTKIEATYLAVIDFIKWYNTTKL